GSDPRQLRRLAFCCGLLCLCLFLGHGLSTCGSCSRCRCGPGSQFCSPSFSFVVNRVWRGRAQPMIRLFVNGLAASAGGGLTYLRNVIPQLARRVDVDTTVLLNPAIRAEFGELPNISLVGDRQPGGAARRFLREQAVLPRLIRRSGAQVLISA